MEKLFAIVALLSLTAIAALPFVLIMAMVKWIFF